MNKQSLASTSTTLRGWQLPECPPRATSVWPGASPGNVLTISWRDCYGHWHRDHWNWRGRNGQRHIFILSTSQDLKTEEKWKLTRRIQLVLCYSSLAHPDSAERADSLGVDWDRSSGAWGSGMQEMGKLSVSDLFLFFLILLAKTVSLLLKTLICAT